MIATAARSFDPDAAAGFQGEIVYELEQPGTGRAPSLWTVTVLDGRAVAREGTTSDPALRLRFRLADFVRIAAGEIDATEPLLRNRASFEGDIGLAARIPEMFGAPSPY
jgi:putative sterol carrier protein